MKRMQPDGGGYKYKNKVETVFKGKRGGIFVNGQCGKKVYLKWEKMIPCENTDTLHSEGPHKISARDIKDLFVITHTQVMSDNSVLIPYNQDFSLFSCHIEGHLMNYPNITSLKVHVLYSPDETAFQSLKEFITNKFSTCMFPVYMEQ